MNNQGDNLDEKFDSDEDYSYSEESLGENFSDDSDVTNVTARASTSNSEHSELVEKSPTPSRSRSTLSSNNSSGLSSSLSTISLGPRSKRWNMSFSNMEMIKIERENHYLQRKIMAQQKPTTIHLHAQQPSRLSSSAINRMRLQRRIHEENMMILRKIHNAKSCVFNNKTPPGCRSTYL